MITSVWSTFGHRFISTDVDGRDGCLTCGALYDLVPDNPTDPTHGAYVASNGDAPQECPTRGDLVHGSERYCEADNGKSCQEFDACGQCQHTEHDCNCIQCQ